MGLLGIPLFLATGQYMDLVHDHLRGMDDVRRMLFRSAHIYILLAALLHLGLGLYLADAPRGRRRGLQRLGSALLLPAVPARRADHEDPSPARGGPLLFR